MIQGIPPGKNRLYIYVYRKQYMGVDNEEVIIFFT